MRGGVLVANVCGGGGSAIVAFGFVPMVRIRVAAPPHLPPPSPGDGGRRRRAGRREVRVHSELVGVHVLLGGAAGAYWEVAEKGRGRGARRGGARGVGQADGPRAGDLGDGYTGRGERNETKNLVVAWGMSHQWSTLSTHRVNGFRL